MLKGKNNPFMQISVGSCIDFFDGKKLRLGLCQDLQKNKALVFNERGKQEKVALKKVFACGPARGYREGWGREEMLACLKGEIELRERLVKGIDIPFLWEFLAEDPRSYPVQELCDLLELEEGEGASRASAQAAVYEALDEDLVYFVRKHQEFEPRGEQEVQKILHRQQKELENERIEGLLLEELSTLLKGDQEFVKPYCFSQETSDLGGKLVTWMRDVVLFERDSSRFQQVMGWCERLKLRGQFRVRDFLLFGGWLDEDENLDLYRESITVGFNQEQEGWAKEAGERKEAILSDSSRMDLTSLKAISIDSASTTEVDDALSLEPLPNGWRVGIHISDASAWIEAESPLDKLAQLRGTSLYLPDLQVRMIPEVLSEDFCSLVEGEARPAFSFLLDLDEDFNLLSHKMVLSKVVVHQRMTYEQMDEILESEKSDSTWAPLLSFAEKLKEERGKRGALLVDFSNVDLKVTSEGEVVVERESRDGLAQTIVSEAMILANHLGAKALHEAECPALYRYQDAPEIKLEELPMHDLKPHHRYKLLRSLKKSSLDSEALFHHGVGVSHYAQMTSPIRRYLDMMLQRQLKSVLLGQEPVYSKEEFEEASLPLQRSMSQSSWLERRRKKHWMIRYLEKRKDQPWEACILAETEKGFLAEIEELALYVDLVYRPEIECEVGDWVSVRVERLGIWDQMIQVTWADG